MFFSSIAQLDSFCLLVCLFLSQADDVCQEQDLKCSLELDSLDMNFIRPQKTHQPVILSDSQLDNASLYWLFLHPCFNLHLQGSYSQINDLHISFNGKLAFLGLRLRYPASINILCFQIIGLGHQRHIIVKVYINRAIS